MPRVINQQMQWNADLMAIILGVFFVVLAILGSVGNPVISPIGVFKVNDAHNLVHLATGVILLVSAYLRGATGAIKGLGVIYALLAIAGVLLPWPLLGHIAMNAADNWLHALFAGMLLAVGFATFAEEQVHPAE
jgi:hypothetical protein